MKIDHHSSLLRHHPEKDAGWALAQQWALYDDIVGPRPNLQDSRQSDLTFKSSHVDQSPKPQMTHITSNSDHLKTHSNSLAAKTAIYASMLSYVSLHIEKSTPESPSLSELTIEPLLAHLEKSTHQPSVYMAPELIEQSSHKNKTIQKPIVTPHAAVMFKPYQLFIDENQAEITLNTTHLSKQQITELQQFIHQWLSQKGYVLKQLMINGEQQ